MVPPHFRHPDLSLPSVHLGFFPTPLTDLPRLSSRLGGPPVLVKRDDLTGLALGGNKTRKLEYLMADALIQGCDCVVTAGAAQSNHCRQSAAAARICGLECHLLLGGDSPDVVTGNLLLDHLLGARIHWMGPSRKGEDLEHWMENLKSQGKFPYAIPYGGSNPLGAMGFVAAAIELKAQLTEREEKVTHLVIASSSGGTQAGLMAGCRIFGLDCEIIGVRIDKEGGDQEVESSRIADLASAVAQGLGWNSTFTREEALLYQAEVMAPYGVVTEKERTAMRVAAETEGLLLDPVYTGRAMAGLMDMIASGRFANTDRILFWHTGGHPALFAGE